MAPPEINYTLIRLVVETIPTYDGDKDLLEIFISAADNFYNKYANLSEEMVSFTHQALLGKLKGNALLIIGSRSELKSWPLVREELRNVYGEQLSLDNLEQMMLTCTLKKNESYQNFGKRLQIIRSKLAQKINTTAITVMDQATKMVHNRQYNALACKIFVRNLDRRLRDKIIVQGPNSLEAAMSLVQEDENFELFLNPNHNQFKQIIPHTTKPNQVSSPNSSNIRPPQKPQFQNFNQNFQNQGFRQTFPSQPINIQPRQIPQHFPTNRQTFGPPQNVWKPQGTSKRVDKPVPMSGVSVIPPTMPNRQNYKPQPMSANTRLTTKPSYYTSKDNTEINTYHESDTASAPPALENTTCYDVHEERTYGVSNDFELEYGAYDTGSNEVQPDYLESDFLITGTTDNQT